jgi:hypothetical protein
LLAFSHVTLPARRASVDDTPKIVTAVGVGALGAAALIFAVVKLVQLPIAIMHFVLVPIQFLLSILGVIAILLGMVVAGWIIVKAIDDEVRIIVKGIEEVLRGISRQLGDLLTAIMDTAKTLKQIEED